jgi:hypothetical protein
MQNVMVEELEAIVAPESDLADFLGGLALGITIGMLICGGA